MADDDRRAAGTGGDDAEAPPTGGRQRGAGRDLQAAIASGLGLAAAFIGAVLLSDWLLLAFVAVLIVVGLLELDTAARTRGWRPATPVAVAGGLVMFLGGYGAGSAAQTLGWVIVVLGSFLWAILDTDRRHATASIAVTLLMAGWVPYLASFLSLLLARSDGGAVTLAVVAFAVSSDIGAYGVGRAFGRRKLAPSISPGKTWEGSLGGLATAVLLAATVTPRIVDVLDTVSAVALAVVVVVAATFGDLAESIVKRDLGVKDLGRIIPGHGGIMDRVDALLFAVPAAHLLLIALGV